MKAGLLLVTLSLVVAAQADKYILSCAKSELGIRWPSYVSNSEYYVCPRLFGKQMTVNCNPGEVFTFALQSCTAPNRYIPAPNVDVLPTAAPLLSKPNKDGYLTPLEITNVGQPPVFNPETPIHLPGGHPQIMPIEVPAHNVIVETPKHEELKPAIVKEEHLAVVEDLVKPMAPMPPTPAPTPPVVAAVSKKPSAKKPVANKKKSASKPSKNGKQKPAASAKKTPKKTAKKPKASAPKKTPKA